MAEINWGLMQQADPVGGLIRGYQVGAGLIRQRREMAREDRRDRALDLAGTDPVAAERGLISAGALPEAAAVRGFADRRRLDDARTAAAPDLASGNYQAAAKKVVGVDPQLATRFMSMGDAELRRTEALGDRAARLFMTAAGIDDPARRQQFIMGHRDEALQSGISPEKFDAIVGSNPEVLRAEGLKFLDVKDLAGQIHVEKFGDDVVTYRTDPIGATELGRKTIPETRAEELDRDQFEETVRSNRADEALAARREGRIRAGGGGSGGVISTGRVMGPIYAKIANGTPLTPGEQKLYSDSRRGSGGLFGDAAGDYGDEEPVAAPARPARAAPPAARPVARPAPGPADALPPRAVAALREGQSTTFANGQVWTLRGGKPARVK